MSPEALANRSPDVSFDLWSLSVVLFEALAGRHPFERATWFETQDAIRHARALDLRALAPGCPADLADTLADCLSPQPRRRPASAEDLRARLAALAPRDRMRGAA
jgi:serine/threonine-protein kinase